MRFIFCCCLVTKSCPTLFRPHGLYSPAGSSVHGILQAGILGWAAMLCSWRSSWLRGWIHISCISGIFLTTVPPGKPLRFTLGWPKSLLRFPHKMFWKNLSELFGLPNTCSNYTKGNLPSVSLLFLHGSHFSALPVDLCSGSIIPALGLLLDNQPWACRPCVYPSYISPCLTELPAGFLHREHSSLLGYK